MFKVLIILYFPGKRILIFFVVVVKDSFSVFFFLFCLFHFRYSVTGRQRYWLNCTYEMIKSIHKGHLFKNANQDFL